MARYKVGDIAIVDMNFGEHAWSKTDATAVQVLQVRWQNSGRDNSYVVELIGMGATLHLWESELFED